MIVILKRLRQSIMDSVIDLNMLAMYNCHSVFVVLFCTSYCIAKYFQGTLFSRIACWTSLHENKFHELLLYCSRMTPYHIKVSSELWRPKRPLVIFIIHGSMGYSELFQYLHPLKLASLLSWLHAYIKKGPWKKKDLPDQAMESLLTRYKF